MRCWGHTTRASCGCACPSCVAPGTWEQLRTRAAFSLWSGRKARKRPGNPVVERWSKDVCDRLGSARSQDYRGRPDAETSFFNAPVLGWGKVCASHHLPHAPTAVRHQPRPGRIAPDNKGRSVAN